MSPSELRSILDIEMDHLRDLFIDNGPQNHRSYFRWFWHLQGFYEEVAEPWEWEVWHWEIISLARLAWEQAEQDLIYNSEQ